MFTRISEDMQAYHNWWESLDRQNQQFYKKLLVGRTGLIDTMALQLNPGNQPADTVFKSPEMRRRFVELVSQAEVVHSSPNEISLLIMPAIKIYSRKRIFLFSRKVW